MLFGDDEDDDLDGFDYSSFQIRIASEDEVSTTKEELKSLHEKIDQLLLASQVSTFEATSKLLLNQSLSELRRNILPMSLLCPRPFLTLLTPARLRPKNSIN